MREILRFDSGQLDFGGAPPRFGGALGGFGDGQLRPLDVGENPLLAALLLGLLPLGFGGVALRFGSSPFHFGGAPIRFGGDLTGCTDRFPHGPAHRLTRDCLAR
ncbi:hypothetical protein ABTY63_26155 [Streptomyces solisilvae]|uniref:hypothetical protein n=1 Tax=Streptomyces malaysiensis TaxID=92644 RepID=UPI003333D4EC